MIPLSFAILPQVWLAIGLLPHGPIAAAVAVHKMVRRWYVKVDCTCGGGIRRHPVAAEQMTQAELDAASERYGHHQWHCGGQPLRGAYTYHVDDPPVAALPAAPGPAAQQWHLQ